MKTEKMFLKNLKIPLVSEQPDFGVCKERNFFRHFLKCVQKLTIPTFWKSCSAIFRGDDVFNDFVSPFYNILSGVHFVSLI